MDDISLFEAMHTQRAIRRFAPDAVPDQAITKILEAATRAPNGGNRQLWHFIVIRDANLSPNPPKDTDGRREDSGRGWVRELQGRWPGVLG